MRIGLAAAALACSLGCGTATDLGAGDAGAATGGATGTGGATQACTRAADCTWTEIDVEIRSTRDCMCLFGCPSIVVNQATATRRQQQFEAFCSYGEDGQGNPCPIDECVIPPALECRAGQCAVAGADAGWNG
jgi:hypothetical protein